MAFDQGVDDSHLLVTALPALAKQIFQQGLVDNWREITPTMRDNTLTIPLLG